MEELVDLEEPYLYMIGIPAGLREHWAYIVDFLHPEENLQQINEPNVELVPPSQRQSREDTTDLEVAPLPEAPSIDLSAAGDGHHVIPQIADNEEPIVIIFLPRIMSLPWSSLKPLKPVIIAASNILFRKILSHLGIDLSQVFALGLSYNTHLTIFHCFMEYLTSWLTG
ncbi:uncharacterized protein LOC117148351 [Drosophila mauritiana]|uniref:Uncharacterized protein LOC117148351 n=1 Tax=Drosophila mauritiana TaxID=7226 RepID=A0A6P8L732_DROMA|nr:uncharacterized protein LOC117148351 [Drosophila mauritiana]